MAQTPNSSYYNQMLAQMQNAMSVPSSPYYTSTDNSLTSGIGSYAPANYISTEDGWTAKDNQEAAGYGWMLVGTNPSYTPTLQALAFGTKKDMSEKELFQDCLESAMCGDNRIAFKILGILTKNRSPWSEFAETHKALVESYG